MSPWLAGVGPAIAVFVALGLIHMAWRMWRGNEQFDAGGSLGHQLTSVFRRNR